MDNCKEVRKVAVLQPNSIGDYIILRNFLAEIKKSGKYKDAEITFIGNIACRDFAQFLDKDTVKDFIWFDFSAKRIKNIFFMLDKKLKFFFTSFFTNITGERFDALFIPTYNRCTWDAFQTMLARKINAAEKIVYNGDMEYRRKSPSKTNKYYTKIVPPAAGDGPESFMFSHNKHFFEQALGAKISFARPCIKNIAPLDIGGPYAVMHFGAGRKIRMWPAERFVKTAVFLKERYDMRTIFICSAEEKKYIENIDICSAGSIILAGKSAGEVMSALAGASLFIGNDSGPFHMAMALGLKCACISSGRDYSRFINYPDKTKLAIMLPAPIEEIIKNGFSKYGLNSVSVGKVTAVIEKML